LTRSSTSSTSSTSTSALTIRSFKLRFRDRHVRVVPSIDPKGCAFSGPGVDILGDEALSVLAEATPMLDLLRSLEPGIDVRSLSLDLEQRRLIASLEPVDGDPRPRVIRIEQHPLVDRIVDESSALITRITEVSTAVLARRPNGV
jgi:hypothetical protein